MSDSHTIEEVRREAELASYAADWDRLAESGTGDPLFGSRSWFQTWVHAFWDPEQLAVLFACHRGTTVAVIPLVRDEDGRLSCPRSMVSPSNHHVVESGLIYESDLGRVASALTDHLRSVGMHWHLRLPRVPVSLG